MVPGDHAENFALGLQRYVGPESRRKLPVQIVEEVSEEVKEVHVRVLQQRVRHLDRHLVRAELCVLAENMLRGEARVRNENTTDRAVLARHVDLHVLRRLPRLLDDELVQTRARVHHGRVEDVLPKLAESLSVLNRAWRAACLR